METIRDKFILQMEIEEIIKLYNQGFISEPEAKEKFWALCQKVHPSFCGRKS